MEAVIFVFSLDDELSFSVLSGYYAKMAQYRKYISDIPVVLVAITGKHNDQIIKARQNVRKRVTIGFGFTSDWPKKWREFFKPITKRSNAQ